jgi:hypothetical protein
MVDHTACALIAGVSIERFQPTFEISMTPLGAFQSSQFGSPMEKCCSDTSPLKFRMNSGIEEECVMAAIAYNVDVSDEATL